PGVALGAIVVNMSTGVPVATACGMGLGNTLEALLGAALLRRLAVEPSLARLRDVFALVVLAAGLSTIAAATIGVGRLPLGGVVAIPALILAAAIAEREQAAARLRGLQSVSDTALAHLALTDLLPRLLDCSKLVLAVDNAAILLLDEQGEELVVHMAQGPEAQV